jgi:hypothetical protein
MAKLETISPKTIGPTGLAGLNGFDLGKRALVGKGRARAAARQGEEKRSPNDN